jgi:N utilization substance protein B
MISRRNIRVKVMQVLYSVISAENTPDIAVEKASKILQQHFDQTKSLLVYLTWFLSEVTRYAEKDARQRATKHIRTEADLHVNQKIAGNEILLKLLADPALKKEFSTHKPELILRRSEEASPELIRKVYHLLSESPTYKSYIAHPEREKHEEKKIIEFILNDMLLSNEIFISHMEDNFSNWDDDGEMIVQLLASYIQKPGNYDFTQMPGKEKEQFAFSLLRTVIEKSEFLQSLIIPKLKNWDPDRIALIDMIIMKMGVSEFLFFETIPPKVTINEYIDLAKEYSTAQSGQFVNGILDNIHKELVQDGKMNKVEYKKTPHS